MRQKYCKHDSLEGTFENTHPHSYPPTHNFFYPMWGKKAFTCTLFIYRISLMKLATVCLTHSHTMTPLGGSGKEAL